MTFSDIYPLPLGMGCICNLGLRLRTGVQVSGKIARVVRAHKRSAEPRSRVYFS